MGAIHVNGQKATGVDITIANGVFMDTSNTIKELTEFKPSMSYEALEDCFVMIYIVFGSNSTIKIDNKIVGNYDGSGSFGISNTFFVKTGQTISVSGASSSYNSYYIVYGLQVGTQMEFGTQYDYVEVTITNPGTTIYQNNYADVTSTTTVDSGKELAGFIQLNAGSKYFTITQISLNADRKIVASICNIIGSGKSYDSDIKFIAVLKSST